MTIDRTEDDDVLCDVLDTGESFLLSTVDTQSGTSRGLARRGRRSGTSFAALVRLAEAHFGHELGSRLGELRNVRREQGERRLIVATVRYALRFLVESAWPVQGIYTTPSGQTQLEWIASEGTRIAARFDRNGSVSFAVSSSRDTASMRMQLFGESPLNDFMVLMNRYRSLVTSEAAHADQETISADTGDTGWRYSGEILSTDRSRSGWESFGGVLSA